MSTTDNPSSAIERHPWLLSMPNWCDIVECHSEQNDPAAWAEDLPFVGPQELREAMRDPELVALYVAPPRDLAKAAADYEMQVGKPAVIPEGMDPARFFQEHKITIYLIRRAIKWCEGLVYGHMREDIALAELNAKYTWVRNLGNKARIAYWVNDPALDRRLLRTVPIETFRANEDNITVEVESLDKNKNPVYSYKPRGTWWTKHSRRREVEGIIFEPNRGEVEGYLNIWQGFAVTPSYGTAHQDFLLHLEHVICAGNAELYEYLLNWLARMVQRPGEPGTVALVFRSTEEGTGKGFTAKMLGRLFGPHYLQVTQPSHLVGNFNAHLRTCCLLFADEAFNPHDKKHEAILKTLITEDTLTIEGKGLDVDTAANCIHLILASNEEHVVAASEFSRRFCVFEVSPDKAQDVEYFGQLDRSMQEGGLRDLLGFLLSRDISGFNVLDVPRTEGLEKQRSLTMPWSDDTWADEIAHQLKGLLERDIVIPVREVYRLVDMEPGRASRRDQLRMTKVMRALGFEKDNVRLDGGAPVKAWRKGKGDLEVRAYWHNERDPDTGEVRRKLAVTAVSVTM